MSTSDDSNKETGNTPAASKTEQDKPQHKTRHAKKTTPNLVTPLLILIIVATAIGGVWLFRNMQQYNVQQQDAINLLRSQVQDAQQQAEKQIQLFQDKLVQQQTSQDELRDNLTTLLQRNDHLRKDWLLGEAEYLLKLASYRLQLERDVTTALRAMQAADERLHDVGDPALVNVRKALAEDQNALRNVPNIDVAGMSLSLSAMIGVVDKLPLNTPMPKDKAAATSETDKLKNIQDWKELPAAIWQTLKGLVVIRHHDENIAQMLSPKEHFYLLQNLRPQLEQARLALLLGKANVYNERITAAQTWLTQFFDKEDAAVINTQQTLEQLAKVNIEPELPGIDKSYQALKAYLAGVPIKTSKVNDKPAAAKKAPEKKPAPAVTKPAPKAEPKVADKVETAPKVEDKKTDKVETAPVVENKPVEKTEAAPTTDSKVQQ